ARRLQRILNPRLDLLGEGLKPAMLRDLMRRRIQPVKCLRMAIDFLRPGRSRHDLRFEARHTHYATLRHVPTLTCSSASPSSTSRRGIPLTNTGSARDASFRTLSSIQP